ncbi:MAG: fumarylacetoacetate hydrolase family protein [Candidatus Krumholzibacteriia bacterium]
MRLITFDRGSGPRTGILLGGQLALDVAAADPGLDGGWERLLDHLDHVRALVARHEPPAPPPKGRPGAPLVELADVQFLPPVTRPQKIIAVGRNYHDHAAEQNRAVPEQPMLFSKAPSCLQGPYGPIMLDSDLDQVDAEGELALVIGKRGRRIAREDARDHIAGYMCMNDVSDRAAQFADKQFFRGKSIDTGGPCGPWLVTPDELPDLATGLRITTRWNGTVMQESNTDLLIFPVDRLVAHASLHMTLEPGDIITTGTPGGVGVFRDPPVFLQPGDLIEVEIEGIGQISNPVVRI